MTDRREIDLPEDPSGIQEPHDVLAAEEFAMPTAGVEHDGGGFEPRSLIPGIALLVVLALVVRKLRS